MTRQLRAILRVTVNSTFGISAFRWRYLVRRERPWELLLIGASVAMGAWFLAYFIYRGALALATAGQMVGQPELAVAMAVLGSQLLVLVMGFFMIVSAFFFAGDLKTLVPLPVSPGTIITAKFLTVAISEYLTIALVFFPAMLAYWQVVPAHPGQVVAAVVVFLALPVVPLALGAVVPLVLMRGISRRQRDLMFYATSLLFLGLVMAWQMAAGRIPEDGNIHQYLVEMITQRLGMVQAIAGRFPPALWATVAVHGSPGPEGLRHLGYTAGSALLAVAGLGVLGNRLFYRGLIGGDEAASRRRPVRGPGAAGRAGTARALAPGQPLLPAARSPWRALMVREWYGLVRTPIWMFNNVLPGLFMPVFMALPVVTGGGLRQLLESVARNPVHLTYAGLALAAILAFVGGTSGLAGTSISREGNRFWLLRVQPQPVRTQLQAKLLLSWSVIAVTSVPTVVAFALLIRPTWLHLVAPTAIGLLVCLGVSALGLRIDAARPMLRWHDPQEPVKRNLNGLLQMALAGLAIVAGSVIATPMLRQGAAPWQVYLVLLVVAATATALACRRLFRAAPTIFDHLEP